MRVFLLPFAWLYHLILIVRHAMFDSGLKSSQSFDLPVICVGNIRLGGTGKTPHIEYLVRLLQKKHKIAILSRGYGRLTKGFIEADSSKTADLIGDEPMQYVTKFPDVTVAVDEKRVEGIKKLQQKTTPPEIILLDDAFQHRNVKAGLNIVLTDYHNLYSDDLLFPSGMLRDTKSSVKRADAVIVTKTPAVFSPFIEQNLRDKLKLSPSQSLFFSYIYYGNMKPIVESTEACIPKSITTILLVTGIANSYPLKEYLNTRCIDLIEIKYGDHHRYTEKDLNLINSSFQNIIGKNKLIITTEKDAMRFKDSPYFRIIESLPLFYVPIKVAFHKSSGESFDAYIEKYVRKN
ncbi:MAG: Tetraacyldisaccharide 4'-kinase [Bacteroidetes bacterium]|nr:MAG: Tetraacyldisaccharide 4'-kinase [Bacteroidota bacterium]